MNISDQDKVTAWLKLYEQQLKRFEESRRGESKVTLATWGMLAAAIYGFVTTDVRLGDAFWFVVGFAILLPFIYGFWVWTIQESLQTDRGLVAQYREWVEAATRNTVELPANGGKPPSHGKMVRHTVLQGATTLMFTLLLVAVAWRDQRGTAPLARVRETWYVTEGPKGDWNGQWSAVTGSAGFPCSVKGPEASTGHCVAIFDAQVVAVTRDADDDANDCNFWGRRTANRIDGVYFCRGGGPYSWSAGVVLNP
jgi:hypothetical protein